MTTDRALSPAKRALLEKLLRGDAAPRDPDPVLPRPPGCEVPISAEQEHVWLHAALAPDAPLYNEALTVHRRGDCDPALLQAAFNEVLRRHEAWRASFCVADGGVVQQIHDGLTVALPLTDLSALPPAMRETEALRLASEDARRPFDLSCAPLLRGRIVRLAAAEHRLYLTLHHIIFDGVSIYRVLVPTLAAIYADMAAGRPAADSGPPVPALQYGDYAVWRARHVAGPAVTRQMQYWSQTLAGPLPVLDLPADHAAPATGAARGGMAAFVLTAALSDSVKQAARDLGVTPYVVLLAAFVALLHRYAGQEDIIVGGVVDMRRRPSLEPLMGYFLNSLPLRTRPAAGLAFRDFARQVSAVVLGALDHCEVPFSRLVRDLRPQRNGVAHPLFNVLFSIEPPAPQFADGWDLTQMDVPVTSAKFDLYLELDERPEGLIGRFLYAAALFDAATIQRMIGHWLTLLAGAVADPACALGGLTLLTAPEAAQLADWNPTAAAAPVAGLHDLVAAQARRTPDATAVIANGERTSYAGLEHDAGRIAGRLRRAGVGPGALVAVCVDRSPQMLAALLGILQTGAAYLPLDAALPAARLRHFLDEARPSLLLAEAALLPALPATGLPVLLLDAAVAADPAPAASVPPDALAYVLCTSGTTGKPKAVEVTHGALVNLLCAMQREPGCSSADSLLAVTTLAFDIAALELFLPLLSGGTVILAGRAEAADPALLAALIERSRPSVMQATPATWAALVEQGWRGLPGLKLLVGGEALSRELAGALLARADSVWNLYGPTETTVWSTLQRVTAGSGVVPIGRPIANTAALVLDPHGNELPVGVAGELYLGGAGVARGYRHQPALTAQRFPILRGQRWYRTGDRVRRRPDGALEWLGRTDDQVKIRGHRIGLGEIEAALEAHPAIAAAALKPCRDAGGSLGLAAYVVPRSTLPDPADLRRFLAATLPDYMLPGRYVAMAALPLTPNGKRDRAALPEPPSPQPAPPPAPAGTLARQVAAMVADLLGHAAVAEGDNFFDLGGHSLLAARLLRRIEQSFGRTLPLASVFEAPTPVQLAERLAAVLPVPEAAADAELRALLLAFESIGEDCEFGLLQRRHGAEPMGLLRFTGIAPDDLLRGLAQHFDGIADPAALRVSESAVAGTFDVANTIYRCSYQTFGEPGQAPDAILQREAAKLRAMRPMLFRTLQRGNRICVFKSRLGLSRDQAAALSAGLRAHGPATLLVVRPADALHPPGAVAAEAPHVLAGWIDRCAPDDDLQDSSPVWLAICRAAHRVWQAGRAAAA